MADRICIVRQGAYYELPVRREAEALRDAGYEVHLVCLREPGGPAREVIDGVTLHRLPLHRHRGAGPLAYLRDYLAFLVAATVTVTALHVRRRFAAVQVNTMPDVLAFAALVPRLLGARAVVFMKEPTPELARARGGSARLAGLLQRVEQAVLSWADLAFTVTDDLKEAYVARGAKPDRITVVLNGPDARHLLDHRSGASPDPAHFTAICHGLVDPRYGHESMVEAVRLAAGRVPGLRLRIIGEGPYGPELERLIDAQGVRDRVAYLGWLDVRDMVAELERADVGIVAQTASAYSHLVHTNKMYEYMLFGKPVIASRLNSTVRYFPDDSVQYFEPGSAEGLADALVELATDPDRRRALVAAAGDRCRSYGWAAQKRIYLAAYAALLHPDGPGRAA